MLNYRIQTWPFFLILPLFLLYFSFLWAPQLHEFFLDFSFIKILLPVFPKLSSFHKFELVFNCPRRFRWFHAAQNEDGKKGGECFECRHWRSHHVTCSGYLSFGPGRDVRGCGELTGCADWDHWETCSRLDDSGLAAMEFLEEFWACRRDRSQLLQAVITHTHTPSSSHKWNAGRASSCWW